VQALCQVGGVVQFRLLDLLRQSGQELLLMLGSGFAVGAKPDFVVEQGEPKGVALLLQGIHQRGSRLCGKAELVLVLELLGILLIPGVVHRRGSIHDQLTPQVGFFLKTFDKNFVRAGKHFPVYIPGTFALVVQAVFGKFDRKTMKRTAVQPNDKTFHDLPGQQFEVAAQGTDVLIFENIRHVLLRSSFAPGKCSICRALTPKRTVEV